jgi:hypothetical protein
MAKKKAKKQAKARSKGSPTKARKKAAPKKPVKSLKKKPVSRAKQRPKPAAKRARKAPGTGGSKKAGTRAAKTRTRRPAAKKAKRAKTLPPPVRLQRERRRLPEADLEPPERTGDLTRTADGDLFAERRRHTESSPALTAGDIDARWQDAYAVGDEAPGGDNPTPDQDRVDDIGKALGIQYDDDEELRGGDELRERDAHRWELDPGSRDDLDE